MEIYYAQCLSGHSWQIDRGTDLEARAKKRVDNGFLDAICVSHDECEECQYEHQRSLRQYDAWG